jgi:hypothetical protein
MQDLLSHTDAETLEQLILGHLSEDNRDRVEDHLLVCEACRQSLDRADVEVMLLKAALRELLSEG